MVTGQLVAPEVGAEATADSVATPDFAMGLTTSSGTYSASP